jgi:hypothetical protein
VGHSIRKAAGRLASRLLIGTVAGAAITAGAVAAPTLASAAPVQHRAVTDLDLDLAVIGKVAALKYCATSAFARNPDGVKVLYGVRQLSSLSSSSSRVFVLRNGQGKILLCDMFGRDRPSVLPLPSPTTSHPAVAFSPGQRRWSCDGTTLRSFKMTNWLKVKDPITSARVRYSVNNVPGPWFTAARHGSFIHLQSWMGPALDTDNLKVELQLLDKAGSPVNVQGFPSGARKLAGCGGGSVIIG